MIERAHVRWGWHCRLAALTLCGALPGCNATSAGLPSGADTDSNKRDASVDIARDAVVPATAEDAGAAPRGELDAGLSADADAATRGSLLEGGASESHVPDAATAAQPDSSVTGAELTDTLTDAQLRALLRITDRMQLPLIPQNNPLTPEKIELGRHLFYDRRLSANQTQSCADCHQQDLAFSDGRARAIGSSGQVLSRNSQGLANVAYFSTLTWANNSLLHLEQQLLVPIINDNPIELGVTDGVREEVLARFDSDPLYVQLLSDAFPSSDSGATIDKLVFAIASFCRTLISVSSRFDQYRAGDKEALTSQEREGLALFNGERFECFHCHSGLLLSTAYRDADTPEDSVNTPFFNNGLYNLDGEGGYPTNDQGLFELTFNPDHRGMFRPPSLRNVALTGPYMHDGSIATLREVVEHYAAGGRLIEEGTLAGDGRLSPLKSGLVRGFDATDEEIEAVVAFLEALTDEDFIDDPRFSQPPR